MVFYKDDQHFCHNKVLIDPNQATLKDLLLLLIRSNIEHRRFVLAYNYEEPSVRFRRRWLIFITVVLQKILLASRSALAWIGDVVETWLNLIYKNGGFSGLLLNFLKGKVVKAEKSSAGFRSILGYLDMRDELEKKIRPGHRKYKASLSLMASKLSYENEAFVNSIVKDRWNMEYMGFYNFWNDQHQENSTQAIMFQDTTSDPNLIVVAFRGTPPFSAVAWCTDLDLSSYELQGIGNIHRGFMKALGVQNNGWPKNIESNHTNQLYAYYIIKDILKQKLQENGNSKFIVTGHSLGGALAILFVAVLFFHDETSLLERLDGVYTFGQPRVGDGKFGSYMEEKLTKFNVRYLRSVYSNDLVPRVPFDDKTTLYKHFGRCLLYDSFYKVRVMWEEPNKNYFSFLWVVPKYMNAYWELIRSFIIPSIEGPEYRESWSMKLFRVVGLIIPGLSAHGPQDYDNCMRLGSLALTFNNQDPFNISKILM